jgi:chitinase
MALLAAVSAVIAGVIVAPASAAGGVSATFSKGSDWGTGYEAGIEDYKVLKNTCPSTGTVAGTAYAYCGSTWWSYDTPSTITGKTNYVKSQGLGGAFFWELSGDTSNGELISALRGSLS